MERALLNLCLDEVSYVVDKVDALQEHVVFLVGIDNWLIHKVVRLYIVRIVDLKILILAYQLSSSC